MKVLFIFNGITKNGNQVSVSGGDIRLLEIMKYSKGVEINILTTPNGLEFLKKYDQPYARSYVINEVVQGGLISNLRISLKACFYGQSGISEYKDSIVYSSCEHLYDVLPAWRLKRRNHCTWYAVYHWVEEYPWRDKRGNTPALARYAYWLNRYFAGWLIKHYADDILAVSDQTKAKLVAIKKINPKKIKAVYCGVEYQKIQRIIKKYAAEKGKTYDAVFMKRLNYGKGVLDLLKIWQGVVSKKPNAKLAIIGDGTAEVLSQIRTFITKNGLDKNIDLLGVIYDDEVKFRVINSAKVFLLPTHEENWAIVIGEAMAAGVPVVVSRLKEIVPIWQDNVVWCRVSDTKDFTGQVTNLLGNPKKAADLAARAHKFIVRYDWKNIADSEFKAPANP